MNVLVLNHEAVKAHMECINSMINDLLEIADVLEEHEVNVKLDDGLYLNPVSAIRSKADVIWDCVFSIVAEMTKIRKDNE